MSANERGLGRGLDALFRNVTPAERPSSAKADSAEVPAPSVPKSTTTLPIAALTPCKGQPRKHFDEAALDELAASIRSQGVIQPLLVRPRRTETATIYEIVAGERRWRAAQRAGLTEVPVYLRELSDEDALTAALIENLQREDLNPIEEAKGYRALQDVYGMTQDDVAQSVGKSRPAVANATRLLALSEPVLKLVEDGTLSAGHARALLPLNDPEMQLAAAKTVIEKGLSVRRAEALAAQLLKDTQEKPAKKAAGVDYLGECARHLEQVLGRKVRMTQGRKTGRIELEYYDADDREALLQALEAIGRRN